MLARSAGASARDRAASIAGCVRWQAAYGLKLLLRISQPLKSAGVIVAARSWMIAVASPPAGSRRRVAAWKPAAASCADSTPSIAALPAWNGFDIVPKEPTRPLA